MADQERNQMKSQYIDESNQDVIDLRNRNNEVYQEETAAEIAVPAYAPGLLRDRSDEDDETVTGGRGLGYSALALSILSLFILPIFFGAAGIILGFVARRKGSVLGSWAIGIGVISILVGMFILPFF